VEVSGWEQKVAVGVDAITHPAQSSFGLIFGVMNDCFNRGREAGLDLLLGVPTPEMMKVLDFAGWKPLRRHVVHLIETAGGKTHLTPGYNLSVANDYQRWRWEECPRQYCHSPEAPQVVFAVRPDLFPAPMMMGGGAQGKQAATAGLTYCLLAPEGESQAESRIIGEAPIYYYYLREKGKMDQPDVSADFSIVEALTLGW
jgi:hypothetical protein